MKSFSLLALFVIIVSCGVRNDPIPPGTQAEIGKGRPEPKAWLVDKTKNLDPSKLKILDDMEEDKKKK